LSSPSKRKGSGYELEIVKAHQALGIEATKTPLSGALGGKYAGDVQIAGYICECKRRRKNFTTLYKAVHQGSGADIVFVRDDTQETLVVLPWQTWKVILEQLGLAKKYPHQSGDL
jgi:Holliday junction resolvase